MWDKLTALGLELHQKPDDKTSSGVGITQQRILHCNIPLQYSQIEF